jgi:hypothetical protein
MIRNRIENFMENRRCTLLGVGPMSCNCVNAAIELANEQDIPLMLIASRRQIECKEFGGGYVNNWSTEKFAEYVIDNDKEGKVILARDHSGPWQNTFEREKQFSLRRTMDSAKRSLEIDILSGFELIHIDTSTDIFTTPSLADVVNRLFELYEFCWTVAQRANRRIVFEIGTEEQTGSVDTAEALEYTLDKTFRFCKANSLPPPMFVVVQTGTRVAEMRNIGSFDSPVRIEGELPAELQIPKMIEICARFNIYMKEHNADYLSDEALRWHPRIGIHAANVAPEFGVAESKAFLAILREHNLESLALEFIELAYASKKWEKWVLVETKTTDEEKAIIAGHYIFGKSEFCEIKRIAQEKLIHNNIVIDDFLKEKVKISITRYLKHFRLMRRS